MLHSVFVLVFLRVAAPLASLIPLAALASALAVVAWNMADAKVFVQLLRQNRAFALILLASFAMVIRRDLIGGIRVGTALACGLRWWNRKTAV